MNRSDHSIELKIIRNNVEKSFNLPFLSNDQLWHQLFKFKESDVRSVEIVAADITIQH
jgi:hypothetical protein